MLPPVTEQLCLQTSVPPHIRTFAFTNKDDDSHLDCPCLRINAQELVHVRFVGESFPPLHSALCSSRYNLHNCASNFPRSIRKRRCHPGPSGSFGPCQMCTVLSVPCSLVPYKEEKFSPVSLPTSENSPDELSWSNLSNSNAPVNPPSSSTTSNMLVTLDTLPVSQENYMLPPPILLRELVELYFRLIHNGPHTLFHEPTFISELESNTLSPMLMLAIISISAR